MGFYFLYLLFFLYYICKVPTVKHLSRVTWSLSGPLSFAHPPEGNFYFHRKRAEDRKIFTKRGKKNPPTKPILEKNTTKSFFMHESQSWHTHSHHLMLQLPVLTLKPYRNALSHIAYLFLWRINMLRMALWSFHSAFDGMLYHIAAYKGTHKH